MQLHHGEHHVQLHSLATSRQASNRSTLLPTKDSWERALRAKGVKGAARQSYRYTTQSPSYPIPRGILHGSMIRNSYDFSQRYEAAASRGRTCLEHERRLATPSVAAPLRRGARVRAAATASPPSPAAASAYPLARGDGAREKRAGNRSGERRAGSCKSFSSFPAQI